MSLLLHKICLIAVVPRFLQTNHLCAHIGRAESNMSYMCLLLEKSFFMLIFNNKLLKVSNYQKLGSFDDE